MKAKSFTEFEFRKVVDGTKMQFRHRIKKIDEKIYEFHHNTDNREISEKNYATFVHKHPESDEVVYDGVSCCMHIPSYFKVGEKVYLKEPYSFEYGNSGELHYKIDGEDEFNKFRLSEDSHFNFMKWKNKLSMPEKYARHFIEITNVRCERLQDISDEDCYNEGLICHSGFDEPTYYEYGNDDTCVGETPQDAYAALIDKINGKGIWDSNPFVWVYDFKLVK
ncbi:hypothetical protein FACS189434_06610 [Bacteroidia bacterium]|nr:hypothetical protein FACS189434_06610 [Bacteroidia bacterium]